MVDGFSIIDIIFLLLALFIGYKMYSMMGVRTGHEKKPDFKNKFGFGAKPKEGKTIEMAPLITGLKKISTADRLFNPEHFLDVAQKIFETVVKGFVAGDRSQLKGLVGGDAQETLEQAIAEREKLKRTADLNFFRLVSAEILESTFEDHIARVTVEFVSEQVLLIHDSKEKIVEGDPNAIDKVTDVWTFEKDTKSKPSKWILVDMKSLEE